MGQSALELTESGHAYKHRILQGVELVEKEIEDRIAAEMIDNRHSDVTRIGLTAKDGEVQILAV